MSRTFMYSKEFPQGKIFDTEPNKADPLIPANGTGWFDDPAKVKINQDQLIEAVVKQELAKQRSDRDKLDAEHKNKFGFEPRGVEPDEHVVKALDDPEQKPRGRPKKV